MSKIKKSLNRRSDDTLDEDSDDKDSKRKSRNLSEKKRRDQFNSLVNELGAMVSTTTKRMDKSTVLKSTISFLKHHNDTTIRAQVNEIKEDWKPTFLTNETFTHLVFEAVDGFIIVFSATSGQIFYASESITSLLGHLPKELLSMTIYDMASEEDHNNMYDILLSPSEDNGQVSFSCHLRRGGSDKKQHLCYELVHFLGYFRSDNDVIRSDSKYNSYTSELDNRLVFVGTGRIQTPQLIREMPLIDSSSKTEFTSRHSLEWKFLFLDHRAPLIIGYLPFELLGTSGYDYYHIDDLDSVINCHEALMQKGEGTSCYYRFLTKGQQWIWLQTRFYISYHQWNSKPEFVVCTHRVISFIDVMKKSRKSDGRENNELTSGESRSVANSSQSSNWNFKISKNTIRHETASDCTSMSADSPISCHSSITQPSTQQQTGQPSTPQANLQDQQQQFLEPLQYVTAIPMQPMISTFTPSALLSPIQPMDNVVISPVQSQMQMDLQRKHAELQAIIGQQQAELRRVSEQLLMTRLGLLTSSPNQQIPISYQGSNTGNVSSTASSILVPVGITMNTFAQNQQQQQKQHIVYNTSNSNEQGK